MGIIHLISGVIDTGKLGGVLTAIGVTLLGFMWFYGIMYNWLWLGLVHSGSTGWIVGYMLLFIIFVILSIPVIVLLGIGYGLAVIICAN